MGGCPTLPAPFAGGWAFRADYNLHECTSSQSAIKTSCLHFITFSCYHRMPLLDPLPAKQTCERELERVRVWYGCYITGYVVMPEHVHLLISEPERSKLSVVIQMLKQITSQKLHAKPLPRFWQVRYYDFPYGPKRNVSRSCATSIAIR